LVRGIELATGATTPIEMKRKVSWKNGDLRSSSDIIPSPGSVIEALEQLNVTFCALRNASMRISPPVTMAQITKDSQRRGKGEESDTKTH